MLKNFNILKGITVALVMVLLLCGGLLLKNYVDAAASTVVYYLSDSGDNTTGADEATAFHTIDQAILAVNEKKLSPGSTVKLIVVDRLTVTTQKVDSVVAVDEMGNRLPITLTSLDGASKADFSELYMAYINSTASSSSQYALFTNDFYFKNIRMTSKVQESYTQFNPSLDYRYLQKSYYFDGQNITFDNVVVQPERRGSDVPSMALYLDHYGSSSTVAFNKQVTIKNCDFTTGVNVYFHNHALPYVDLTVTTENSSFGTVYASYTSSSSKTDDLKSLTCNLNSGTSITGFYYTRSSAHLNVTDGMVFNYRDCKISTIAAPSNSTASTIACDITHNFYGAAIGTFYGSAYGKMEGNITNNIYEGTTITDYRGGGSGETVIVSGDIVNNINGASFAGDFYAGPVGGATYKNIVNNISDSEFAKKVYFGGNASGETVTTKADNIRVGSTFFAGNYNGDCETLKTELTNSTCSKEYYGGGVKGNYGQIFNSITNSTLSTEFYGGIQTGEVKDITNNFYKGTTVGTRAYCGNYGSAGAKLTGTLTNNFYDGTTFGNTVYTGGRYDSISGKIVNNFYGGTFKTTVYGGLRQPASASSYKDDPDKYIDAIYNNIYGGTFAGGFAGGHSEVGARVKNCIVNVVNGGTFNSDFVGGNINGEVTGNVTTTINAGTFKGKIIGGNKTTGNVVGKIETTINGGNVTAGVVGVSTATDAKDGSATLTFNPAGSTTLLSVSGVVGAYDGLTTSLVGGNQTMSITNKTDITANSVTGTLLVVKTDVWVEDQVYITLTSPANADSIQVLNESSIVTGVGVFDGTNLIGSSGVGFEANAPRLADLISFYLDEKLGVCFWVPKNAINEYIQKTGSWGYTALLSGELIGSETFTAPDSFAAESIQTYNGEEYFTFTAGVGVSSTEYGETISINLAGVATTDFTVYELLERGIDCNSADAEIVNLLSAIHTYGVEAYNVFEGGSEDVKYYVDYQGDYSAPAELTGTRGYGFVGSSMTLDEQVSLNLYVKALNEVSFKVFDTKTGKELDASKIKVIPVTNNSYYNYVVSLKLTVPEMQNSYTVKVFSGSAEVATCTYSVANCCYAYECAVEAKQAEYAGVARALIAYIEASQKILSR